MGACLFLCDNRINPFSDWVLPPAVSWVASFFLISTSPPCARHTAPRHKRPQANSEVWPRVHAVYAEHKPRVFCLKDDSEQVSQGWHRTSLPQGVGQRNSKQIFCRREELRQKYSAVLSTDALLWSTTTSQLSSRYLFLPVSSRKEGVIKWGERKAELSPWNWATSTSRVYVCSWITRAVWEGTGIPNLERREGTINVHILQG